jgi:hypothetical protein
MCDIDDVKVCEKQKYLRFKSNVITNTENKRTVNQFKRFVKNLNLAGNSIYHKKLFPSDAQVRKIQINDLGDYREAKNINL